MIYFCADDYGLNNESSQRILQCTDEGVINKVSVFPNFYTADIKDFEEKENIRLSLHLNLVEGKCMGDAREIDLIADKEGNFKYTFGGLFKLWLFQGKRFEAQLYKEIRAQVLFWKSCIPQNTPFCIDSHQHTHMIPAVFRALMKVLDDEKIKAEYIRIPAEPILPYIKIPSLYLSYSPVNIIKQWLLKALWMFNKKLLKKQNIPTAYFCGILFSGKMDEKRVRKVLTEYIKLAEKNSKDIEVLFHPGYINEDEKDFADKNIVFEKFYLSKNRKTEYDSVMKITERRVP